MKIKYFIILFFLIVTPNAQSQQILSKQECESLSGSFVNFENRNSYNAKMTLFKKHFISSLSITKIENDYIEALKMNKFENTTIFSISIGYMSQEISKTIPISLNFNTSLGISENIFIPSLSIQSFYKIQILNSFLFPSIGINYTISNLSRPDYSKVISTGFSDSYDLYHENRTGNNICGYLSLYIPINISGRILSINLSRILDKKNNYQVGLSYLLPTKF